MCAYPVAIRNTVDAIASVGERAYIRFMNTFLVILLIAAMIATVVALVRGVVSFLQEGSAQVRDGNGPSAASLKSNRMQQRIFFQALAILIVVVILFAAGRN
jgi:hypothetical protein